MNYAEYSFKNNLVYATGCGNENKNIPSDAVRAQNIYLHGSIENINGYDICKVNVSTLLKLLSLGLHLVTVIDIFGNRHECLLMAKISLQEIYGLIVKIDDIECIRSLKSLFSLKEVHGDTPYTYLKENHKEVYDILK